MDEWKLTGSERSLLKEMRHYRDPQATLKRLLSEQDMDEAPSCIQDLINCGDRSMPGLSQAQENERFDLTPGKWARREAAAVASFERAKKELRGVCNMAEMPAVWGIANTLQLMGGYDHRDENQHALLTGAALWIMDQAYAQGKLEELLSLLPERITPMPLCEGAEEPFSAMPLMQHPLYQTADIWHLVRLLANRNAELVRPSMVACSVTDEWTVSMQRTPTEGHPQRQAFEAIMKLIDPDAAARAAARFEEKVWTFTRLALGANQRMEDKLNSLQRHVGVLESKLGRNAYAGSGMRAPVRMPENWALLGKTTPAQEQLQEELAAARAKAEAFFEAIGGFRTVLALPNDREHCLEQFKDNLPQDTYEQLLHFSVEDPYETCFAVLYLLDAGSDVPWIYYGALAVTYTALDQLPFAYSPLDDETDEPRISEDLLTLYDYRYPCHGKFEGETDSDGESIDRSIGLNLAHLLYGYTGTVWPRYTDHAPLPDELRSALLQASQDGCDVFSLLLSPLHAGKYEKLTFSEAELMGMDPPEETAEPDETADQLERLSAQCRQQRREIEMLRAACRQAEQQFKTLHAEKAQQEAVSERFRLELAELRESVYRSQSGQTPEEAPAEAAVSFPLHTSRKIVSFGGHPAWLNSIRALLPDVRFIEPDHLPDEQLIRNADAVWLQCNCMSHSDFFKIVRTATSANIPLHYFGTASAEQCARQLAGAEADVKA